MNGRDGGERPVGTRTSPGAVPDGGNFGRREVAYRLFAAEFEDADLEYSDSEEERAPNYVVTPTGARVNRLFVVGVLTEIESVSDDVLRARVVDPTGAFVVYAGQYQPEAVAFLEGAEVPSFVAVTGKARTFRPEGAARVFTSVRPETMTAVDEETRDRWTVQAAEHTIARVATMARALDREERGEALAAVLRDAGVEPGLAAGVALAIDHYGTTRAYLAAVREQSVAAAAVVAGEREAAPSLDVEPDGDGPVDVDLAGAPRVFGTLAGELDEVAAVESTAGTGPEPAETATTPAASGTDADPNADATPTREPADEGVSGAEASSDAASSAASDASADSSAVSSDSTDGPDADPDEELGDFDEYGGEDEPSGEAVPTADVEPTGDGERFDLDESEREQVEAEYGTEFSTGSDVGEPGEAGIEPEAEQPSTDAAPEAGEAASDAEPTDADATDAADEAVAGESAEPDEAAVDLEAAVVEAMATLDDGDGADREAVVEAVVDDHGLDPEAVEAAIQDALMEGRCYEPADGTLKAI